MGRTPTEQMDQTLADTMVLNAIVYCAEKKYSGDVREVSQALLQGRCDICSYLSESIIQQVGEYLGQVDKTVRAIYRYEPEYITGRASSDHRMRNGRRGGINLVAWVERKSAALNALGDTLEAVLSESRQKIGCKNAKPACFTFDLQLVDHKDVTERRGYGIVVNNMYVRSNQVWAREDQSKAPRPVEADTEWKGYTDALASFDPELAPESLLLEYAMEIEKLPEHERAPFEHTLRDIKVTLIRRMISDQLTYINIAKDWFTFSDLADIYHHKIGYGKIGGKAAGMLLAARILNEVASEADRACIRVPESFFLGSDVVYVFMAMNGLMHWNNQKYKPEEQIRAEYAQVREAFQSGRFPPEVLSALQDVLEKVGSKPVIVRSSSQLEDNFGTAFAGKYDSHFCSNQGSPKENLRALTNAIALTYASTLKPEALLYRRSKGLQDYDERMAILIQVVQGEPFNRYYLPTGAGVAFSHNLYRWSPIIRREDGFVRLVWGLGTRAVERVGDDYPRLVALSHPTLQPDDAPETIRHYSQRYVDLIDIEENVFKTLPILEVLKSNYPPLRYITQLEEEGYLLTPRSRIMGADIPRLVITFDELLRRTPFAAILSRILRSLEEQYHSAVDMEFTVNIADPLAAQPGVQITLLQCRPQSYIKSTKVVRIPKQLTTEEIIFSTNFITPQGHLPDIRYVLFVPPDEYYSLYTQNARKEIGAVIARLNYLLEDKSFICVGPGRWGTTNTDLGVYVSYSDICNSGALVELSGKGTGVAPEPSLGTHFFQDLMEAQIYPVAVNLDDQKTIFNRDFFYNTPSCLADWMACDNRDIPCIRLLEVAAFKPGHHLELAMDDEQGLAVAYISPD
jgi:hypothetical protein